MQLNVETRGSSVMKFHVCISEFGQYLRIKEFEAESLSKAQLHFDKLIRSDEHLKWRHPKTKDRIFFSATEAQRRCSILYG